MTGIICASVLFGAGGGLMKASDGFTRVAPSVLLATCFVLGAALMARAVNEAGLSTTYVMGLGVEAIVAVVVGIALFGEHLRPMHFGGIALIVSGVALLRW